MKAHLTQFRTCINGDGLTYSLCVTCSARSKPTNYQPVIDEWMQLHVRAATSVIPRKSIKEQGLNSLEIPKAPPFMADAACRETDPEVFFPPEGGTGLEARRICKSCPVQLECLTYALDYEEAHPGSRWGVYGGTTARQRRTMTTKPRKASA